MTDGAYTACRNTYHYYPVVKFQLRKKCTKTNVDLDAVSIFNNSETNISELDPDQYVIYHHFWELASPETTSMLTMSCSLSILVKMQ